MKSFGKRMNNHLLGVSAKTPPTLTKSRRTQHEKQKSRSESISSDNNESHTADDEEAATEEEEESSVEGDTKLLALTVTQLALCEKSNNFVDTSSSESSLSTDSKFDKISAEQKA